MRDKRDKNKIPALVHYSMGSVANSGKASSNKTYLNHCLTSKAAHFPIRQENYCCHIDIRMNKRWASKNDFNWNYGRNYCQFFSIKRYFIIEEPCSPEIPLRILRTRLWCFEPESRYNSTAHAHCVPYVRVTWKNVCIVYCNKYPLSTL